MDMQDFKRNLNSVLVAIISFIMIIQLFFCFSVLVNGQSEIAFNSNDKFEIPTQNSSIRFAINGTYEVASLQNGVWSFENLRFINSQIEENLDLKVSASDCEVTITLYRTYNRTLAGSNVKSVYLRYSVLGQGTQVFDLGVDPDRGDLGLRFNREFIGVTHGWNSSPDGTFVITGATANVTLSYYGYPESYGDGGDYFDGHSVIISSTFFVGVVVVLAGFFTLKKKELK